MKLQVTAAAREDADFMQIVGRVESLPPALVDELYADVKACGYLYPEAANVERFVQLMVLKTFCRDFDPILLSPTPDVDQVCTGCQSRRRDAFRTELCPEPPAPRLAGHTQVWHIVMVNPKLYAAFCNHIAGRLIGHTLHPATPPEPRREAASKLHAKFFLDAADPSQAAGGRRTHVDAVDIKRRDEEGGVIGLWFKNLVGVPVWVVLGCRRDGEGPSRRDRGEGGDPNRRPAPDLRGPEASLRFSRGSDHHAGLLRDRRRLYGPPRAQAARMLVVVITMQPEQPYC